jgi:simple sugar transport system permease protein
LAASGEIFAERSGVLNLGVEGMMLLGAATGFAVGHLTSSLLCGLVAAALASALLAVVHATVTVYLRGDQVVSGLGLGFAGAGLASVVGADFVGAAGAPRSPVLRVPWLCDVPLLGPALFAQNLVVYLGFILVPAAWLYLYRTGMGLKLRAVGENPSAADAQGINVRSVRVGHVVMGGALAGLAGGSLSLGITPGWVDGMTAGQGWIAVGLVIFAGWDPARAAAGSYLFGAIGRLPLDLQGVASLPFFRDPNLGYFLDMLPYLFTIAALALVRLGRRGPALGPPAGLGIPFVRGERGR